MKLNSSNQWLRSNRIQQWCIFTILVSVQCLAVSAGAQIQFPIPNIPNVIGEYQQSYFSSNIDVAAFIGSTGKNFWDFSKPQGANEVAWRMDVVPVSDGGHGGDFSGAAFAQRSEGGPFAATTWEYYTTDATNGLTFYGSYSTAGYGSNPNVPITPPTPIFPPVIHYGDSWSIAYTFNVVDPFFGGVPVSYTSTCTADAYGQAALPGIGVVPVLRVTQSEDYDENIFGLDFPQLDTNWYWLAPGVGFAAQATAFAPDTYSLSAETYTNSFSRVFQNPPLAARPAAIISWEANMAELIWSSVPAASGYAIQTSTNLINPIWAPVTQLTNLSFSVPVISGVGCQFFKITAQP